MKATKQMPPNILADIKEEQWTPLLILDIGKARTLTIGRGKR